MENHANKSKDSGNDRLSELPDDILHSILRRLESPNRAAQTAALSTRWRSLWLSYPVAEFGSCNGGRDSDLKKFCIATIHKFSRDELMRMDSLKVSAGKYNYHNLSSWVFGQLVDLASKRKAKEIVLEGIRSRLVLKLGSFSNSCAKILILENIVLRNDHRPLSLNCLRFLRLSDVELKNERIFADLIAGSPLLETLELKRIDELRKIRVSNLANLKMLAIDYCYGLEEIEIAAPRLKLLRLTGIREELKIDVTAPQLNVLDIAVDRLDMDYLNAVLISRLQQLKSLTVAGEFLVSPKLKFSKPLLEEFNLRAPRGLEEIELVLGPHMRRFLLSCYPTLKKCEIENASTNCRWEVDYRLWAIGQQPEWFIGFKSFMTRFTRFDTVTVRCVDYSKSAFRNLELDWSEHPKAIKHLKITASSLLQAHQVAALCRGLFWACRPTFLTIICKNFERLERFLCIDQCPELLSHILFELNLRKPLEGENKQGFDEHSSWQHHLKDVKIVTKGVDPVVEDEETEKGLMSVSEEVVKLYGTKDRVCFKLTWL